MVLKYTHMFILFTSCNYQTELEGCSVYSCCLWLGACILQTSSGLSSHVVYAWNTLCNHDELHFLQQKGLQLVFIMHQFIFDTFKDLLEFRI